MTGPVVLDASAVLVLTQGEAGADQVEKVLRGATVPAVNWAEVLQQAQRAGANVLVAAATLKGMGIRVVDVNQADAEAAARLARDNPKLTLSLADRFCLAVAERLRQRVLTADRLWSEVVTPAKVVLIR